MTPSLDTEKQLYELRRALKLLACLISPLLTLQLFLAVTRLSLSREMYAEMGGAALPTIYTILASRPLLIQCLPFLSFAAFIALLIICFRVRTTLFLHYFAISLFLHLLLIWLFDFIAGLPLQHIIQSMQQY